MSSRFVWFVYTAVQDHASEDAGIAGKPRCRGSHGSGTGFFSARAPSHSK